MSEQHMPRPPRMTRLWINKEPLVLDVVKTAIQDPLIESIWAHLCRSAGAEVGMVEVDLPSHIDVEVVQHFDELLGPAVTDEEKEEKFVRSWSFLLLTLQERARVFVDMLGPNLDEWLLRRLRVFLTGESDAILMLRGVHQLPGSVWTIGPDGGVHGLEDAEWEDLLEFITI